MNENVTCPDCGSRDLQKIEKDYTLMTDDRDGGCLSLLFKKKDNTKTLTDTYYACRGCGKEFRVNTQL